jgi:hypothetical protein
MSSRTNPKTMKKTQKKTPNTRNGPLYAILVATVASAIAFIPSGCGKKSAESGGVNIPASSFRADPSKMTESDKQKMNEMMRGGGGKPPTK